MSYEDTLKGQQQTTDNFTDTTDVNILPPDIKSEIIEVQERTSVIKRRSIINSSIWGIAIWKTDLWNDTYSKGFILGTPTNGVLGQNILGDPETEFIDYNISNPNNLFKESYTHVWLADTGSTTADISSIGSITIDAGSMYTSLNIFKSSTEQIQSVTLYNDDITNLTFQIKTDQQDWTSVGSEVALLLSAPASELQYRIKSDSIGSGIINELQIDYI